MMEAGETCSTFVNRVKEQDQKLNNMGGESVEHELDHKIEGRSLQSSFHTCAQLVCARKVVEDVIRGYGNTPPLVKQLLTEGSKSAGKVNFAGKLRGKTPRKCAVGDAIVGGI
jgi:hypothetical protein